MNPSVTVVGVGSAGSNAVSHLAQAPEPGTRYLLVDTDPQVLANLARRIRTTAPNGVPSSPPGHCVQPTAGSVSRDCRVILLDASHQPGRPACRRDETARVVALASRAQIASLLSDGQVVIIACGLGGGTGSGAAAAIAAIARSTGSLCVAVASTPFAFEGRARANTAERAALELRSNCDALFVTHNDRLLNSLPGRPSLEVALRTGDELIRQAIRALAGLSRTQRRVEPVLRLDLATLRCLFSQHGETGLAVAEARGHDGAVQATHAALGSPLMDMRRIRWASGVLLHVQAGPQLPIRQVEAAARLVGGLAPESADMRMGVTLSGTLGDRARATIVLTGIRQQQTRLSIPASRPSAWPPRREVAQVAYAA